MVYIPNVTFPDFNFTNFRHDIIGFGMQGYISVFGFFLYPFIFSIVITCVYLYFRSAVLAAAVALIIFTTLGNTFLGVGAWVTMMHILISLGFAALILMFLIRRRER